MKLLRKIISYLLRHRRRTFWRNGRKWQVRCVEGCKWYEMVE